MIVDRFENWGQYFHGKVCQFVLSYINELNENSPETEMEPLCGEDIKARVMSYSTKDISEAIFEAHKRYIDIQFTLSGEEGIGWIPEVMAQLHKDYDPENDVGFYRVDTSKINIIKNVPGQFMVLFPGEVHGAGIWLNNTIKSVKKAVVKIDRQVFENSEIE